jgi:IS30 family transposase
MLGALLKEGLSFRKCARNIGTSPTTISNEVSNNGGRDNYKPSLAQKRCLNLRHKANQCHRKLGKDEELTGKILELLKKDWSPQQIAGRMILEWGFMLSSPTSIYNYINPRKELHHLLPRKCNKYRRTKAAKQRKALREALSNKKSIDLRPCVVNERKEIGHWEGDTIVGKEKSARILTYVERKSGYLVASLMEKVSGELVNETTVRIFQRLPRSKKLSLTLDNGIEFSEYEATEREANIPIYFAHPYHSWERGTNENTNGLIRRYYQKGTYFSSINEKQFKNAVKNINHRPRKRLGYKTPYEVFYGVTVRTLI